MKKILATIIMLLIAQSVFAEIYYDLHLFELTNSLIEYSFTGKRFNEKPKNFIIYWGTPDEFNENGMGYTTPDTNYGFKIVINEKIKIIKNN